MSDATDATASEHARELSRHGWRKRRPVDTDTLPLGPGFERDEPPAVAKIAQGTPPKRRTAHTSRAAHRAMQASEAGNNTATRVTKKEAIRQAIVASGSRGRTRKELAKALAFLRDTVNGRVRELVEERDAAGVHTGAFVEAGERGGEKIVKARAFAL